jgi:hypothetical protein
MTIVDFDPDPEPLEAAVDPLDPELDELLPQAATVASTGSTASTASRLLDSNFINVAILMSCRSGGGCLPPENRVLKIPENRVLSAKLVTGFTSVKLKW